MKSPIRALAVACAALAVVVAATGCCCPGGPSIPSASMRDRAPEQGPPTWSASAQSR